MSDRVIWKFELKPAEPTMMPPGSTILHVGSQHGWQACVWALVTPCDPAEFVVRRLRVAMTGDEPPRGRYVGTFILERDGIVGHIFDEDWPA